MIKTAEPLILAVETSCDDTAAAVVHGNAVLSNVIASQTVHNDWGGIVPEIASREHVKAIGHVVDKALRDAEVTPSELDALAVTYGPGLAGSLLVGTQFVKGLGLSLNKPIYPIHHIEAHVYSSYLEEPTLPMPSMCLIVSGGHTALFHVESWTAHTIVGSTRDDAAGEAFDKVAKMLGLGYPGGPHIDRLSKIGNATAFDFPRGLRHDEGFEFSFSGLKTAVRRTITAHTTIEMGHGVDRVTQPLASTVVADIAASVQRAIVDVLVEKTTAAAAFYNVQTVCIAGGVSANSGLRERLTDECSKRGWQFVAPRMSYCVDNAAMIGFVAAQRMQAGHPPQEEFSVDPRPMRSR